MDNPEDLACAIAVESRPFLEEHGTEAAGLEEADLGQWSSKSACSMSGTRVNGNNQRLSFKALGVINAIGLLMNLAMAAYVISTWILKHPTCSGCACNDGPWCKFLD